MVFICDLIFSEKYIFLLKKPNHGQKTSKKYAKKPKYLKNARQIDDIIGLTCGFRPEVLVEILPAAFRVQVQFVVRYVDPYSAGHVLDAAPAVARRVRRPFPKVFRPPVPRFVNQQVAVVEGDLCACGIIIEI